MIAVCVGTGHILVRCYVARALGRGCTPRSEGICAEGAGTHA